MNRLIKKVAVLGSGVMGSRIALHFANIGVPVLLLDIVPRELTPDEAKKGLTLESPAVRNRLVNAALQAAITSNPSPVYRKADAKRVTTGNFDDNLKDIAACDWIIEVVVERLDIKRSLYEKVEAVRKPGTLITSNTSGIPIHLLAEGRSEDFRKNFCGTHFFNPPRYLKLLEIIPTADTDPAVTDFLLDYGDRYLGKTNTVLYPHRLNTRVLNDVRTDTEDHVSFPPVWKSAHQKVFHLAHRRIQSDEQRFGDDGVTDVEFDDIRDRDNVLHIMIMQTVPGIHLQPPRMGMLRRYADTLQFMTTGRHAVRIGIFSGMQFHHRRPGTTCSINLLVVRVDEQ